ncbi:peroxisomal membrane protein PEX14 isoform X2 [Bacillus rossius redtenbacheri]|uniref:peroxisomal membrane protein PEX14 isoform X2 n=1 Tax=Bacillus rossius redtenbacheri TaxID=93214 RepID=UPI002FDD4884
MTLDGDDRVGEIQQQTPLRENLVNTAVAFLRNPAVQRSPHSRQHAFLKGKGLSDQEVAAAFQRSQRDAFQAQAQLPASLSPVALPALSPWSRFRDVGNTAALLAGLVYAVYVLYKRYVEHRLFSTEPRKSSARLLDELRTELLGAVEGLRSELVRVGTELAGVQQQSDDLRSLRSEVASLKALLLSRNQFPAVSSAPSIPAWQLQERDEKASGESGSGSSEPELVTKNDSSDSSVDLLRD